MTRHSSRPWLSPLEQAAPWLALTVLLLFTYAKFFQVPYAGFFWSSDGKVYEIYLSTASDYGLQLGDQLVQVGPVLWNDFRANWRQTLFDDLEPGQVVPLLVKHNGQTLSLPWTFPGFNSNEFFARLNGEWFLAYVFWAAGTITLLSLRPKDARWRLLIAFNFLTALWLIVGGSTAPYHTWGSLFVLHAAVWACLPVYLHLHWVFPSPLRRLPIPIIWAGYLAGGVLAALEWFQLLPRSAYSLGFILAIVGSLALLAAHYTFRPEHRRDIFQLLRVGVLAFVPSIVLGIVGVFGTLPAQLKGGALLAFPFIPVAYLYTTYRRQLGGMEVRANRIISLFLFLFLLSLALITLIALLEPYFHFAGDDFVVAAGAAAITALAVVFVFPRFQRFVEHRLLGMPLRPTKLLETYAERIIISPDERTLIRLLKDEIAPSLLIRQSALLSLDDSTASPVYIQGLEKSQLPAASGIPNLIANAGRYHPATPDEAAHPASWVRLALVLSIEQKPIGMWLLGKRDPDDFYSQEEIAVLQSLVHQTAIALTNILQAGRLRAFYQADIEANENQRAEVARELHDKLLNDLAGLKNSISEQNAPPHFFERFDATITGVRQTISGLRPSMLTYGLGPALDALVDDLSDRDENGPAILFEVSADGARYDPQVELHVYRIVQQACENAIKHASAKSVTIIGRLGLALIDLTIEDDGKGFEAGTRLDLHGLAAHKHFGLMGMYERAALIGADIQFLSAPGSGTKIRIHWKRDGH